MGDRNSKLKETLGGFLKNAWDLMILQLLWLICSLPIITMGPATSALFSVMLKITGDEPVSTAKEFFAALKQNFKQALVLGLIALVGAVIAYVDVVYALSLEGTMKTVFLVVSGVVIGVWLIFVTVCFPLQSRFNNTLKNHIRNSFLVSFCSPARLVLMWIVYAIPVLLILFAYNLVIYVGWIYVFYAVSVPVYINSKILHKIFNKMNGGVENDQERSEDTGGETGFPDDN